MLIRVSFAGAEAVGTVGSEFTFDASVNPNNTMLIRELRFHSSIRCWSGRGEFDVKIWWEGKPLLAAKMNAKFQESGADWKSFNDLLFFMEGIAGEIGLQTVRISPVQIIDAWRDLNSQRRLTNQQNSFLKFDIGDLSSVKIDEVVCYLKCVVGSFAFCVLLKQRVQSDSMNDAQRILELGPSTLLSKYAVSCEDEDKHSPMEAEYNALLAGTENNRAILFLGDMRGRIF